MALAFTAVCSVGRIAREGLQSASDCMWSKHAACSKKKRPLRVRAALRPGARVALTCVLRGATYERIPPVRRSCRHGARSAAGQRKQIGFATPTTVGRDDDDHSLVGGHCYGPADLACRGWAVRRSPNRPPDWAQQEAEGTCFLLCKAVNVTASLAGARTRSFPRPQCPRSRPRPTNRVTMRS